MDGVEHVSDADAAIFDSAKPFLLMSMALGVSIDYLFYNDDMPSVLSAKEKKTLEEAAEILGRVYAKK